ncbi:MAG TPA: hypothetical protein VMP08_15900 [Anaerolineae bacterium]|nr:hypothetical protein [Anaerolineae bacterium]
MNLTPSGAAGEGQSRKALAKIITDKYHLRPVLPSEGQTIGLN